METIVRRPDADREARVRRQRNVAIGIALGVLALLFYAVTIVKVGPGILMRPL